MAGEDFNKGAIAKTAHERGRLLDKPGEEKISEGFLPERHMIIRYLTRVFSGCRREDRIFLVQIWKPSWK